MLVSPYANVYNDRYDYRMEGLATSGLPSETVASAGVGLSSIGLSGDTVTISREAKALRKDLEEQKEQKELLAKGGNVAEGNVASKAPKTEEADKESESQVELLQKMLKAAQERLKKAQDKMNQAMLEAQRAESEPEKEMAQSKVTMAQQEVANIQSEVMEISKQLQEAIQAETQMQMSESM